MVYTLEPRCEFALVEYTRHPPAKAVVSFYASGDETMSNDGRTSTYGAAVRHGGYSFCDRRTTQVCSSYRLPRNSLLDVGVRLCNVSYDCKSTATYHHWLLPTASAYNCRFRECGGAQDPLLARVHQTIMLPVNEAQGTRPRPHPTAVHTPLAWASYEAENQRMNEHTPLEPHLVPKRHACLRSRDTR